MGWDRFVQQSTTGYNRDGFVMFEVTEKAQALPEGRFTQHPGGVSGIVYNDFHHRPAWTVYRFDQSPENPAQMRAIQQWLPPSDAGPTGFREIPANRLLRFTYEQEGADFTGMSRLRSAYGCWKSKLTFMTLNAIRHERMAVGTPSLTMPEDVGEDEVVVAENILAQMRSHEEGYILLPFGYDFKWSESSAGAGTDIEEAIDQCNRDIYINVHSGFMFLGVGSASGSFALAANQRAMFNLSLEGDARFFCDALNKGSDGWSVVRRLVDLNYGPNFPAPSLIARNLPTRDWTELLPVAFNQIQAGGLVPDKAYRDFVREVLFLPPEDGTTPVLMERADDATS